MQKYRVREYRNGFEEPPTSDRELYADDKYLYERGVPVSSANAPLETLRRVGETLRTSGREYTRLS